MLLRIHPRLLALSFVSFALELVETIILLPRLAVLVSNLEPLFLSTILNSFPLTNQPNLPISRFQDCWILEWL